MGFVAGQNAPNGRTMSRAGAIIPRWEGTVTQKTCGFEEYGAAVGERAADIVLAIQSVL